MTTTATALTTRWRVLYTVGLLLGLLTAGFGSGSWFGLATGGMPSKFAIPGVLLVFLILGRLVWVWWRPQELTWPATDGLHKFAKLSLAAAVIGIVGVLALVGSGFFVRTLAIDGRGAVRLVIGFFLLPFIAPASLGPIVFEWARGWSTRVAVPAADRPVLTIAALVGALLAIAPTVSSALFPIDSLTRSQYDGVLPWFVFALGLAALIVRGRRGDRYPASAVFSTTLASYGVVAVVATVLSGPLGYIAELAPGKALLTDGAGFALVLAVVPAGALATIDRVGATRSASWLIRALVAIPLMLTVAWLGISMGTTAMRPQPAPMREWVLSDEQLSAQAKRLQQRCTEAGTQVFGTRTNVTELEVRFPDEPRRDSRARRLPIHPDASRPHDWFPRRKPMPIYDLVVFALDGRRLGHGVDLRQSDGIGSVDSSNIYPRHVLTWKSLQTPEEEADGIAGTEMTIMDTQDNIVLARSVLFFRRTNDDFGMFKEACGMLARNRTSLGYAYEWATTILIPKSMSAKRRMKQPSQVE